MSQMVLVLCTSSSNNWPKSCIYKALKKTLGLHCLRKKGEKGKSPNPHKSAWGLWQAPGAPWPPAASIAVTFGRNEKNPGVLQEGANAVDEILAWSWAVSLGVRKPWVWEQPVPRQQGRGAQRMLLSIVQTEPQKLPLQFCCLLWSHSLLSSMEKRHQVYSAGNIHK